MVNFELIKKFKLKVLSMAAFTFCDSNPLFQITTRFHQLLEYVKGIATLPLLRFILGRSIWNVNARSVSFVANISTKTRDNRTRFQDSKPCFAFQITIFRRSGERGEDELDQVIMTALFKARHPSPVEQGPDSIEK